MRQRGAVEPRAQPSGPAEAGFGRLEVTVEVVDSEQLQVDCPGRRRGFGSGLGFLRARAETKRR
jgi:hypothetical protein